MIWLNIAATCLVPWALPACASPISVLLAGRIVGLEGGLAEMPVCNDFVAIAAGGLQSLSPKSDDTTFLL